MSTYIIWLCNLDINFQCRKYTVTTKWFWDNSTPYSWILDENVDGKRHESGRKATRKWTESGVKVNGKRRESGRSIWKKTVLSHGHWYQGERSISNLDGHLSKWAIIRLKLDGRFKRRRSCIRPDDCHLSKWTAIWLKVHGSFGE